MSQVNPAASKGPISAVNSGSMSFAAMFLLEQRARDLWPSLLHVFGERCDDTRWSRPLVSPAQSPGRRGPGPACADTAPAAWSREARRVRSCGSRSFPRTSATRRAKGTCLKPVDRKMLARIDLDLQPQRDRRRVLGIEPVDEGDASLGLFPLRFAEPRIERRRAALPSSDPPAPPASARDRCLPNSGRPV